jgi:predicted metal-dependent phosphoesterase TrpH
LIDLHLHTTASDGLLSPAALVRRAQAAGLTTISVTDHDTVAGLDEGRQTAATLGIELVNGIEITAVHRERDVHILGYFMDIGAPVLGPFLERQRQLRIDRVREIASRLTQLGAPIDVDAVLASAAERPGRAIGRPAIALALVTAGHVGTWQEAFDRFLTHGAPAFVPRVGPAPTDVVRLIHDAHGLASMAHPGVTRQPEVVDALIAGELDAIEVFHPDHPPEQRREWRELARRHALLVTGGSDFHGDGRDRVLAGATLPAEDFARLVEAVDARQGRR